MNRTITNRLTFILGLAVLMVTALPMMALAAEEAEPPALFATGWAVLPPLVAIVLALITKEVYSSLFLGIVTGGILYAGGNFAGVLNHILQDGLIASLADSYNVGILVFLVVLGILVAMMNKSGGSAAFGRWAKNKIASRRGAQYSTVLLGTLIFVDDYFNCLTVGSVMKPLTDQHRVSRAKLAYLIDATAAPICIIAPISSWAAAVSGFANDAGAENGLALFIRAIPYNFYALFTIAMMIMILAMNFDYGKMARYERNAYEQGDLFTVRDQNAINAELEENNQINEKGHVMDLLFPVIVLIIACVIGMIYTGGFFGGESFINAFANCDASVALSMGSLVALVIIIIYYVIRRVIKFSDCMGCVPEGFKQMVSPILILTLAWSLKAMTDSLGLKEFVETIVPRNFVGLFPAVLFLIACVLAFASGTSWGTFGILIPIGLAITANNPEMVIPVISACMAGAVCGDHCSPISDTTIMASAGAACNHISHVETQLPYAITVAAVSAVTYVVAGFTKSPIIPLVVGLILLYGVLRFMKSRAGSYSPAAADNNTAA